LDKFNELQARTGLGKPNKGKEVARMPSKTGDRVVSKKRLAEVVIEDEPPRKRSLRLLPPKESPSPSSPSSSSSSLPSPSPLPTPMPKKKTRGPTKPEGSVLLYQKEVARLRKLLEEERTMRERSQGSGRNGLGVSASSLKEVVKRPIDEQKRR